MTDSPTVVLNQLIGLGDDPDDITYTDQGDHVVIGIGPVHISVTPSSQAALDKLATVTAAAAAAQRRNTLREVA
ncbi:hypothetical protein ACF1BS_03700 [Streptomyces sp. NPDC014748]|uniref:hypothetical protein n=1 Tax=Streptomyces sp. NPDC014748 TaxID=3364905 RepID=UPI0037030886